MNQIARIHSVETCGTVDGPGIRYVIFFQGCPLKCKYCHNPDTWNAAKGMSLSVDDLLADILKYRSYITRSGGGITASGGEPLLQADFLTQLFKKCRQKGIHTALDTSGYAALDKVKPLLAYTDLVLLDIKSFLPETFAEVTGVSIRPVLDFTRCLADHKIPVWIRFVLVPQLTDRLENISQLADYLSSYGNIQQVDVLPFHKMGEYKWQQLGYDYQLTNTCPPDHDSLMRAKDIFRQRGLNVP